MSRIQAAMSKREPPVPLTDEYREELVGMLLEIAELVIEAATFVSSGKPTRERRARERKSKPESSPEREP